MAKKEKEKTGCVIEEISDEEENIIKEEAKNSTNITDIKPKSEEIKEESKEEESKEKEEEHEEDKYPIPNRERGGDTDK